MHPSILIFTLQEFPHGNVDGNHTPGRNETLLVGLGIANATPTIQPLKEYSTLTDTVSVKELTNRSQLFLVVREDLHSESSRGLPACSNRQFNQASWILV
jgi:hypothetical protein